MVVSAIRYCAVARALTRDGVKYTTEIATDLEIVCRRA